MSEIQGEFHKMGGTGAALENALFGFMDGLVTDMAVVAGVLAAPSSTLYFIVVAAVAATLASSVSMFLGAYVAARSRYRFTMSERARELEEVDTVPETERQEVRDIYAAQGFSKDEVETFVRRITSDKELWVRTMMREELGFGEEEMTPPKISTEGIIGLTTFLGSMVPLLPFLVALELPKSTVVLGLSLVDFTFVISVILSACALATVGAFKERFGERKPVRGAIEMVCAGLGGAALVYLVVNGISLLLAH